MKRIPVSYTHLDVYKRQHDEMVINYQTKIQDGKGYELFSKLFYYYVTKTEQKLRYSYTDVNFPDITIRANEENMKKITHNL